MSRSSARFWYLSTALCWYLTNLAIDIVSFIPSAIFRKFEKRLDYYWSDNWEKEGIDAYLVEVIDEDQPRFNEYIAYLHSWQKLYSNTKRQGDNSLAPKGFLIVKIS